MSLRLATQFELLVDGTPVPVSHTQQRLLAYLALARHPVDRATVGGALWLDVPQRRANGSLRSALWRCGALGYPVVRLSDERLTLDQSVRVDLDDLAAVCLGIIAGDDVDALDRLPELIDGAEILPSWDEEWLVVERERYRQMRLHALERAGEVFLAAGECGLAIDVGLAILQSEPLRESAHRLVVQTHLREGNLTDAVRQYRRYERLLMDELGVGPSPSIAAVIEPLLVRTFIDRGGRGHSQHVQTAATPTRQNDGSTVSV